ncbi:MAG: ORF6N domain-containing protein [Planctomycetes bacterium]|nr:ORF6N domain-containing protein [Planctomycetota bacterium]MBM4082634.1 ORF6N domain-containing protein [Planctomycetota bacterium]
MGSTELAPIENLISEVRGLKVMLDADLARVYGVPTKRLNEQVRRNRERFPDDFAFQLTYQEVTNLKSQFATSSWEHGGRRKLPYAFTEHGAIMAANVLRSPRAVQMSVFVVRAFVKMRAALTDTRELARKLAALEKELKERLDVHEAAIVGILQRIMDVIAPRPLPEPERDKIGFRVGEDGVSYRVRRRHRIKV